MIDKLSDTWQHVVKVIDNELLVLNKRLISPSVSHEETQFIRGRINSLSMIKELPDKPAIPITGIDNYN